MRLVVKAFSEACITTGTLILLFVVYVLHWTGVQAGAATDGQLDTLQRQWAGQDVPDRQPAAGPPPPKPYEDGKGLAVMYVPRFGKDWEWPVLEGTRAATLKKGLGHYTPTARLGERGNFAVAGHRRTHGDPFKDVPRLRPGDAIVLTDGTTWFTYRVDTKPYRTVPTDIGVIDPVPRASGYAGPGRYLTLTTCEPEWGSSHRLIVWAHLDATRPVTAGRPEALDS
ncbi:class E sortase [Streptomyces purpureus]|uniref:class E sortase n=1 Tax=Streptomyces purpureus TaxID=1951 RepID=UPI00037D64E4|nr:class E sortase [Streptomyces purpureus]